MISSEKRVSLFGNNVDLQDASLSSYLNESTPVLKLTHPPQINSKKKVEDGEIGIFGAEKYFKGAMDEELPRTPNPIKPANYHPKDPQEKDEPPPKLKTESATPSVHSESSWNSRSGLLVNGGDQRIHRSRREKTSTVKSLLASLGCNCNDKASVKIAENRVRIKELVKLPAKAGDFDSDKMNMKREDCFTFPVLNSRPTVKTEIPKDEEGDITNVKTRRNSLEVLGSPVLEKGKKSFSLERKLTMLNWDGVTPRAENINMSKNGGGNDAESDTSSDLFEIESFSTNGNNSFLARQVSNGRSSNATLPNGYAPSEASIAWSVVTASMADFSMISDYDDGRTPKTHNMTAGRNVKAGGDMERVIKGTGLLSGCNSHKSVRVAGEHLVVSSGEKAAVTVGTATTERCCLNSIMPIVKFQAETKPMSSLPRTRSPRASHHLYIRQQ